MNEAVEPTWPPQRFGQKLHEAIEKKKERDAMPTEIPVKKPAIPAPHRAKVIHLNEEGMPITSRMKPAPEPTEPTEEGQTVIRTGQAERVFEQECEAYPEAIRLFAEGRLRIEGRSVRITKDQSS